MRSPIFYIVVGVLAVALGLWLGGTPGRVYVPERAQRNRAVNVMRDRQLEAGELQRKKVQYECPLGKETLAREKGFIGPGEKVLRRA